MSKTTSRSAAYLFNAFHAKTGDALAKLILLALANRANDDGECYPSLAKIAEDCETSESSVKRKLIILEALGLIRRINRSVEGVKTSNLYKMQNGSERPNDGSERPKGGVTVTLGVGSERPIKHAVETPIETLGKKISCLEDFEVTDGVRKWASKNGFRGINAYAEEFVDYCEAKNPKYKNYEAGFRNWIRRGEKQKANGGKWQ